MSFKLRASNLQNVAPGNIATLKLATGANAPTLDKIIFELSGAGFDVADIEWVRVNANGKPIWNEGSGSIINVRDDYRGIFTSATMLTLDFTEPNARNGAVEQLLGSIPLSLLQDFSVDIKLAAAAPAVGRIDTQIAVRQPTKNPYVTKKLQTTQAFPASGEQILFIPTGGAGGKLKRMWVHELTPGTITDVEIRMGNATVNETNRAKMEHSQKLNKLVPQAGMVVIDFIEDGNLSGVLDTGNAAGVELRLQSSAGNTYTVYYEFIDPIGRL